MQRLIPLKSAGVIKKLRKIGFSGPFPGGKHIRMVNLKTGKIVPIPVHKGKDVSIGLIREIINEIGISRKEWMEL